MILLKLKIYSSESKNELTTIRRLLQTIQRKQLNMIRNLLMLIMQKQMKALLKLMTTLLFL